MKKQFLEIGRIVSTQGIKGEVRVQYYCDDVEDICGFDTLYLDKGKTEINITGCRPHKNVAVMKIQNINTIEAAQPLIGKMLYINRDHAELEEGVFFIQDLLGSKVYDFDTEILYGEVDEVLQNGCTDIYSIKTLDGKQLLFPAIPEILLERDLDNQIIKIRPLKGLFDDAEEIR